MEVGIALPNQFAAGTALGDGLRAAIEVARLGHQLGYGALLAGEHRLSDPYPYCAPIPFLARMAGEAPGARLVAMNLLALHQPVTVAEDLATLDAACGGRLTVCFALGYRPLEWAALGVAPVRRVARFEEALTLVQRLWHDDEVEFHGEFFDVPRTVVATRPAGHDGPPIWMAANSERAIRRAGTRGFPWLVAPATGPVELTRGLAVHREAAPTGPIEVPIIREVFVDVTSRRAREVVGPAIAEKYATYARWGHEPPRAAAPADDVDTLSAGRFIVGDPSECREAVARLREETGVTTLFVHSHWAGFPVEHTLRSLRLFAEQVAPAA
jgi:alkanesulfonate monooxygenase SsuD/methylene tetrahydromethanopterin reductase-like flavin-dependent oxidoreductase (luciferase family)